MDKNSDQVRTANFEPALAVHLLMQAVMVGSVAWSIAAFINWALAVPIAIAFTYVFGRMAKTVVSSDPDVTKVQRVRAAIGAWFVFCVTMGLSYGSLYQAIFAETSALRHFQTVRVPAQRQLDLVLADAVAARNAIASWAADSSAKAVAESRPNDGGGTCPNRSGTNGRRGPITMWREAEANIATKLNADLSAAVGGLERHVNGTAKTKPNNFADAAQTTAQLNAAIEAGEALTHGGVIRSASEVLERQLQSSIRWPDGSEFSCGDTARDELIRSAQSSLQALQALPSLNPIEAAIDLSNRQEIATRGLLRSFNAGTTLLSFGLAGSFADDDLMQKALKENGAVNRETLGLFLASLIELTVLLTAGMAANRGASPMTPDPLKAFDAWQDAADRSQGAARLLHTISLPVAKAGFNFLWAAPQLAGRPTDSARPVFKASLHPVVELEDDPQIPARELGWAKRLLPFMFAFHDKDYIILPHDRAPLASQAIRALDFKNAASLIGTEVSWQSVCQHLTAARRLLRLVPDARQLTYEVYMLAPTFAQALRVQLLEDGVKGGSTAEGRAPRGGPSLTIPDQ